MARYYSEQTLLDMKDKDMNCVYGLTDLEEYLAGVPTADVVPRAVIAEIFKEIEKVSCRISESDQNGFIRVLCYQLSAEKFAELKKKYTEENK